MDEAERRHDDDVFAAAIADGIPVDWQKASGGVSVPPERLRAYQALERMHREFDPRAARSETLATGFDIHEEVGHGSFGRVYRAIDRALGREVALKILAPKAGFTAEARDRFLREARILASLDHPNIVRVHSIDEEDGKLRVSLEKIDGRSLDKVVLEDGPLVPDEAARIGIDLCRALAALHAKGLVHCDVKASNVMRAADGRIVLLDFGLARAKRGSGLFPEPGDADSEVTIAGTPLYMAPEQFEGDETTPATDLYAVGVLLHWLVAARHPIEGATFVELRDRARAGLTTPLAEHCPDAPKELCTLVSRLLSRRPASRGTSALALEERLRELRDALVANDRRRDRRDQGPASTSVKSDGSDARGAPRPRFAATDRARLIVLTSLAALFLGSILWPFLSNGADMDVELTTVYLVCAVAGGTILAIQTILLLLGMGGEHGIGDHAEFHHGDGSLESDHAGETLVKLLSLKALVAFVTFFGLAGLATGEAGVPRVPSLIVALLAGGGALIGVSYLMAGLARLQSRGNISLANAVGRSAKVYLRIPGGNAGPGKVTVLVQGRKVECRAVTGGVEIPTGAEVKIVGLTAADTVEVVPLNQV